MIAVKEKSINIKDLTFGEPGRDNWSIRFDPERDLSKGEWGVIEEFVANPIYDYFEDYAEHTFENGANLKILSPERFKKIYSSEMRWIGQRDELMAATAHEYLDKYTRRHTDGMKLFSLIKIFPMVPNWSPEEAGIYRKDKKNLKDVKLLLDRAYSNHFRSDDERLEKVLFLKNLFLDDFKELHTEQYFNDHLDNMEMMSSVEWIEDSVIFGAKLRMVFPERLSNLQIAPQVWSNWIDHLHEINKHERPEQFLQYATSLAVLSARNVRVTEDGVKIDNNMKSDLTEKNEIPQRRRF
jgi:hypothetical protein